MSDELMTCCECGTSFSLRIEGDLPVNSCPNCGTPLSEQINRRVDVKKLKLRDNRSLSEDHKSCPACNLLSPKLSRICTHCGYNWETGKTTKTKFQKKTDYKRYFGIFLFLVLFGGATAWFVRAFLPHKEKGLPATDPPPQSSIQNRQTQDFNHWKKELETKYPLLQSGQQASFELTTGRVLKGQIQNIQAHSVVVISEQGPTEIQFSQLRNNSRVQIDKTYRNQMIQNARERILAP